MLDIHFILQNKEIIEKAIKDRQKEPVDIDNIEILHKKRNSILEDVNNINQQRKEAADNRDIEKGKSLKEDLSRKESELKEVTKELTGLLSQIPNIPSPDTPIGKDENENVVLRKWGELPDFSFTPKAHWDIGTERGFIDNERAAKTSGARFTFLKGPLVKLQFALIQWAIDTLSNESVLSDIIRKNDLSIDPVPFVPVIPPAAIKPNMLFGMGRLEPKEDKYYIESDDIFLAGSAEHTLGTMHANEMFDEDVFPLRYVGYSTAFRREAGTYGKDTKGILRQHQFDKLEMESFTVGERSKVEQDFLVAIQEYFMQQLGLPYQVVSVCTGDMGTPDVRQIDIETWMPGQGVYRETHSADLVGEYQARRLGIKVKRNSGEKEFVHMNDATVFAIGRTLIAIIENYQQESGNIEVPEVLRPYMQQQTHI